MAKPLTLVELHDAIAKAIADAIGHGLREKCERQADAVMMVVGPQLLATAEHAERIEADERAVPVAWQQKRRPEDYPDEWRECSKETFDFVNQRKESPWIVRELFDNPPAQAAQVDKPPRLGGCCCGEPCTLGVVHRTDGPCFVYEQPADSGRVADASAEDRFEQYVKTLIDHAPDVQKLGERLAHLLDDDQFNNIEPTLLGIAAALAAQGQGDEWLPMDTAPRDGAMLRLLVQFEDHATEDTAGPAPTIGAYCEGAECWQFAGWCWSHDHFTEGKGTPVGWLPMLSPASPAGVPDAKTEMDYEYDEEGLLDTYCTGHMDGWNDCRKAMLAAASAPTPASRETDRG